MQHNISILKHIGCMHGAYIMGCEEEEESKYIKVVPTNECVCSKQQGLGYRVRQLSQLQSFDSFAANMYKQRERDPPPHPPHLDVVSSLPLTSPFLFAFFSLSLALSVYLLSLLLLVTAIIIIIRKRKPMHTNTPLPHKLQHHPPPPHPTNTDNSPLIINSLPILYINIFIYLVGPFEVDQSVPCQF